ncbi:MAG TPA: hypothetical protein VHO06_17110 [Polyangia bacterium]|nr:hypothetical protein [Polyangia bacterium]
MGVKLQHRVHQLLLRHALFLRRHQQVASRLGSASSTVWPFPFRSRFHFRELLKEIRHHLESDALLQQLIVEVWRRPSVHVKRAAFEGRRQLFFAYPSVSTPLARPIHVSRARVF